MMIRRARSTRHAAVLLTTAALSACGGHSNSSNSQSSHAGSADATTDQEVVQTPPRAYYDALVVNALQLIDAAATGTTTASADPTAPSSPMPVVDPNASTVTQTLPPAVGPMPAALPMPTAADANQAPMPATGSTLPQTTASGTTTVTPPAAPAPAGMAQLFINFDGQTVAKGYGMGQSFLLCKDSATIPAVTMLTASDRTMIVDGVQHYFTAAKAPLHVTSTKPVSGEYTTVIVGGTIAALGCDDHGEYGASPLDVANANHNDVAFAFVKDGISDQQLAVTIAHLAGHTYGLATSTDASDVMAQSPSVNATGFGDKAALAAGGVQNEPSLLGKALTPASAAAPSGEGTLPPILAAIPGIELVVDELTKMSGGQMTPATMGSVINAMKTIGSQINPKDISTVLNDNGIAYPMPAGSVINSNNTITGNNINITINIINNSNNQTTVAAPAANANATASASSSSSADAGAGAGHHKGCGWIFGNKGATASQPSAPATPIAPNGTVSTDTATKIAGLMNSVQSTVQMVKKNAAPSDQPCLQKLLKAGCASGYLGLVGTTI